MKKIYSEAKDRNGKIVGRVEAEVAVPYCVISYNPLDGKRFDYLFVREPANAIMFSQQYNARGFVTEIVNTTVSTERN